MIKYKAIKITGTNAPQIADLVYRTYTNFNSDEGSKEATTEYLSLYDSKTNKPNDLAERFNYSNINFAAFSNDKLIGVIRGKSNKITNLFVDKKYHHLGVGSKLLDLFEKQCKKNKSDYIKTRSSLYATNFYLRNGYKKTTGIRLFQGLRNQPVKKILN